MFRSEKQTFIQRIIAENQATTHGEKVLWSRHATARLVDHGLSRADVDVEEALTKCEVIEDYPTIHRFMPDCLVLGYLSSGDPFHAVVAIDKANQRLFVVTVYIPVSERWQDDWRIRK